MNMTVRHLSLLALAISTWPVALVVSAQCPPSLAASDTAQTVAPEAAALQQALFERDEATAMKLLKQTGLANVVFAGGSTPLHTLAQVPITEPGLARNDPDGVVCARLMRAVLESGADPNAGNALHLTPLMVLAISGADTADRVVLAKILIEGGAAVDKQDDVGNTALIYAAQGGRARLAAFLLERGADKTIRNGGNETARDVALGNSHSAVVEVLSRD